MKHLLTTTGKIVFNILLLMLGLFICYLASESPQAAVKLAITVAAVATLAALIIRRLE
jgi:galactitol-specific phosphotransferase system IIC component